MEEVLEKANAISAEKIGVTVDIQFKNEDQFTLDLTMSLGKPEMIRRFL